MEHVTYINQSLLLLISFYSGYKGTGKAINGRKQVLAISLLHLKHQYLIDIAAQVLYNGHSCTVAALAQ